MGSEREFRSLNLSWYAAYIHPPGTTPGRFEGSPDWQSRRLGRVWERKEPNERT